MKKIVSRGACLLFALCLSLNAVGCQKSNENNKIKEGQSISSEEAGMSINANGKNETFKPSDYTLEAKKEYVYEYLGLKFKLSDKFRNYIADKKIAMLDDQSPIDKELKYAILTFEKMTEEQKKEVAAYQTQQLKQAILHAQNSQCDLLILDEIMASYNLGLIDKDMLKEFILNKPEALELVLTGRDPADYMIEAADYVTEMKKIKHPFDAGIPARLGVEW